MSLCEGRYVPRLRWSGFTLVELMVALAVLGLLTAIAVPSMMGLIRDARLSTQADLLTSTLNSARLEAIKQRKNMTVCPAANPNSDTACSANAADWSKGIMIFDGTGIIQRISAKGDVSIDSSTVASIVFVGTVGSASAASFKFCVEGRKQQEVLVAASGHISKQINATVCS